MNQEDYDNPFIAGEVYFSDENKVKLKVAGVFQDRVSAIVYQWENDDWVKSAFLVDFWETFADMLEDDDEPPPPAIIAGVFDPDKLPYFFFPVADAVVERTNYTGPME